MGNLLKTKAKKRKEKSYTRTKEYKKMAASMKKRIEKGVKWLDSQFDRGEWLEKLNVLNLNLRNTGTCVCGQIFGDYCYANFVLPSGKEVKGETLGFDLVDGETGTGYAYDLLTYLWAKKVVALKFKNGFGE